jgi:hypothetical protein
VYWRLVFRSEPRGVGAPRDFATDAT